MAVHREPSRADLTPRTLTALDRCDGCGAQAWARAFFRNPDDPTKLRDLSFCRHHWLIARTSDSLPEFVHVIDETDRLLTE